MQKRATLRPSAALLRRALTPQSRRLEEWPDPTRTHSPIPSLKGFAIGCDVSRGELASDMGGGLDSQLLSLERHSACVSKLCMITHMPVNFLFIACGGRRPFENPSRKYVVVDETCRR